ncbi:MAG: hypothetical protein LH480_09130 [Rubrivivax sp.]|nr:hypothetical protein [Rubrivivax sp.]
MKTKCVWSALTTGIAAAVLGLTRAGRASRS